jgi:hypothetical protein
MLKGTIWDGLDETHIKLDIDTIEDLFCAKAPTLT